jgi:quercetin dioxygenase-like cupin family protein
MPAGCEIAVLRGDPAKPNADIYLRVPAGAEIPAHSHTSAERIILVGGELDVTYQGHAPTKLKAGSYAYGPAKLPHKATCVGADPCTLFIAFELPIDATAHEGAL